MGSLMPYERVERAAMDLTNSDLASTHASAQACIITIARTHARTRAPRGGGGGAPPPPPRGAPVKLWVVEQGLRVDQALVGVAEGQRRIPSMKTMRVVGVGSRRAGTPG
jgi:hypothetical protein